MKTLLVLPLAALALAGCATQAPQYANGPVDPYAWHTVSVTPVVPGTAQRSGGQVQYSEEPVQKVYVQQPVYVQPAYPVYGAPVYAAPSYGYPPVSIGLDFVFTNRRGWWGRGRR